jgi:hypothetical protein
MRSRRAARTLVVLLLAAACTSQPTPRSSGGTVGASPPASAAASLSGSTGQTQTEAPTAAATEPGTPIGSAAAPSAGEPAASVGLAEATSFTWAEISVGGGAPAAREDHTWTVDPAGAYAYLYGGRDGETTFGDLWRYDLAADSWEELQPGGTAPESRFGHVAVWVTEVGLVVWSGQRGELFFGDLWAYDPDDGTWSELPSEGEIPAPRYGSCGALDPDGRLWISHGFTDDGRFFDTRAYDFATGQWTEETPDGPQPVERCLHDCLGTPDGRFILYAGQTTGVTALSDLWVLTRGGSADEAAVWTQEPQPPPPARNQYAVAQVEGRAFFFGGTGNDDGELDDLWTLTLDGLQWAPTETSGTRPEGREGSTLIHDPVSDRLLLFGGRTDAGGLADVWELSPQGS